MASGIPGSTAGTSKRDKGAPARRARVLQSLAMQGGIVAILLVLAFLERANTRSLLLYLATLIVPLGWGYAFWSTLQRDERARREGAWSPTFAQAERKRAMGIMGGLVVVWVLLALAIFSLT